MYRIAVLDDSEIWCLILKTMLVRCGFSVTTFTCASSFLQSAEQFDLALVDFSIPARSFQRQLDGCEVIAEIKERLENPPIVILMSAYFTDGLLSTACDLCPCADAYLSKDLVKECSGGIELEQFISSDAHPDPFRVLQMEPLLSAITQVVSKQN